VTVRAYGTHPFGVAVLHGGPGAPGYMAPVARELADASGVIEPLQSRDSLDGQIEELADQLTADGNPPLILIGSSWGAVLALFLAARRPELVRKIILIGSAVFDAKSSASIEPRRLARLSEPARQRYGDLMRELKTAPEGQRESLFSEWGKLHFDADVYDPITRDLEVIETQPEINRKVWSDYVLLRDRAGHLRDLFASIKAPTVVIHGEYDPHPIEGIEPLLRECLANVTIHVLPNCGHYPWIERQARDRFFDLLNRELSQI
jgi:pimeloyl-ACP methyl ester carboxylesterase